MSLQIKRKFLEDAVIDSSKVEDAAIVKSKVAADAIDNTKIRLLAGAPLRAVSQLNANNSIKLIEGSIDSGVEIVKALSRDGSMKEIGIRSELESFATTAVANHKTAHFDPLKLIVDKLDGADTLSGSVKKQIKDAITALVDGAPAALDTLKEIADYIAVDPNADVAAAITAAIDALRAEIQSNASTAVDSFSEVNAVTSALQTELNTTQTSVGLNANGSLPALGGNYLGSAIDLVAALQILDSQIKGTNNAISSLTGGDLADIQLEIDRIEAASGLNALGNYVPSVEAGTEVIQSAVSVLSADKQLAKAIKALAGATNQSVSSSGVASFVAPSGTTYLGAATSLMDASKKLDAQIAILRGADTVAGSVAKAQKDAEANAKSYVDKLIGVESSVVATFSALATAMSDDSAATGIVQYLGQVRDGLDTAKAAAGLDPLTGTYVVEASSTYLQSATSLASADAALDAALAQVDSNIGLAESAIGQLRAEFDQEVADRAAEDIAVSAQMAALIQAEASARVSDVAAINARQFHKKPILSLTAADIAGIVLDHKAMEDSITISVGRLLLIEDVDFLVDNAHLVGEEQRSKITFTAAFQSSDEKLEVGDSLFIRYMNA